MTRPNWTPYFDATRTAGATANLGQAAVVDGDDLFGTLGYVDVANGLSEGWVSSAWAIEMWVKSDGTDRGQYVMNNMGSPYTGDWPAIIFDYNRRHARVVDAWRPHRHPATPTITDTDWHHLVYTVYGNGTNGVADRIDVAMDGVVQTSVALGSSINTFVNLEGALFVGAHNYTGGSGFSGAIDEVAFYELSGMTEAEVAAKSADLAGHYALAQSAPVANVAFVDPAGISYDPSGGCPGGNRQLRRQHRSRVA